MHSVAGAPRISRQPPGVQLEFDVYMWPLIVLTMPPVMTVDDLDYMQAAYEAVFAAPTRHALVVDTTTFDKVPGADLRRRMKAFEDSMRSVIARKNICSGIIIQNSLVRGAYTALRWISPQPAPNRAFADLRQATRWCIEGIEGDGQTVPLAARVLAGTASALSA